MKRAFLILIALCVPALIFGAAEVTDATTLESAGNAETEVTWNLTTTDDDFPNKFSFGFYKSAEDFASGTETETVDLITKVDNNGAVKGTGSVVVGWKITSPTPVKLSIYAQEALGGSIDWYGTFDTDKSFGGTGKYGDSHVQTIYSDEEGFELTRSSNKTVNIETVDAQNNTPGAYQGTMVLKIEPRDAAGFGS